jgi:DNA-binding MarR family transcriptional regulator
MLHNNFIAPVLGKTGKLLGTLINEKLAKEGFTLTREQWVVLARLYYADNMVQSELANITERDKTTLTRLLNNMEKKGYLQREIASTDKRRRMVSLTTKGRQCFEDSMPVMNDIIERLHKGFSDSEIQTAIQLIIKFKENILKELSNQTS